MKRILSLLMILAFLLGMGAVNSYADEPDLSAAFTNADIKEAVYKAIDKDKAVTEPVYASELAKITSLDVSGKVLSDLPGVELLTGLTNLNCSNNKLTSLDVAKWPALEFLNALNNKLSTLNLSGCDRLKQAYVNGNALTTLTGASGLPKLLYLNCSQNNLTSLDVSGNPLLQTLYCDHNKLTSLNLDNSPKLFLLNASDNELVSLDLASQKAALEDLNASRNKLTTLNLSGFAKLEKADLTNNKLATLDASQNPMLLQLACYSNELTALNLTDTPRLNTLNVSYNQLARESAVTGLKATYTGGYVFHPQTYELGDGTDVKNPVKKHKWESWPRWLQFLCFIALGGFIWMWWF